MGPRNVTPASAHFIVKEIAAPLIEMFDWVPMPRTRPKVTERCQPQGQGTPRTVGTDVEDRQPRSRLWHDAPTAIARGCSCPAPNPETKPCAFLVSAMPRLARNCAVCPWSASIGRIPERTSGSLVHPRSRIGSARTSSGAKRRNSSMIRQSSWSHRCGLPGSSSWRATNHLYHSPARPSASLCVRSIPVPR